MSEFKQYRRSQIAELRVYVPGETLPDYVSVSAPDKEAGSPKGGDMIARNPKNHADQWLVAKQYFLDNFEELEPSAPGDSFQEAHEAKALHNTTVSQAKDNVSDLITWGDADMFKLLCKASSKKEGWMKSTKAMEIPGAGCVVQVTTQQGDHVAEAVTFVHGVRIREAISDEGVVVGRYLENMWPLPPSEQAE